MDAGPSPLVKMLLRNVAAGPKRLTNTAAVLSTTLFTTVIPLVVSPKQLPISGVMKPPRSAFRSSRLRLYRTVTSSVLMPWSAQR
jgi:hypothetical protein